MDGKTDASFFMEFKIPFAVNKVICVSSETIATPLLLVSSDHHWVVSKRVIPVVPYLFCILLQDRNSTGYPKASPMAPPISEPLIRSFITFFPIVFFNPLAELI